MRGILGVGVDIVETARFRPWIDKPAMVERWFGLEESAGLPEGRPEEYLAARFAAKEAFGKALGIGLSGFSTREVQVSREEGGRPELLLSGKALEAFKGSGGRKAHLSMSHDAGMAVAFVVIEGD
jgi:holo-[acyl-carrier protein] synthase